MVVGFDSGTKHIDLPESPSFKISLYNQRRVLCVHIGEHQDAPAQSVGVISVSLDQVILVSEGQWPFATVIQHTMDNYIKSEKHLQHLPPIFLLLYQI